MPNHVTTKITIESNHQIVVDFMKSKENLFDFNNLIPMPSSLKIDSSTETAAAFLYALTNGYQEDYSPPFRHMKYFGSAFNPFSNWDDELESSKRVFNSSQNVDALKKLGETALDNYNKYGVTTWYEWCPKNWGTKWNAYDVLVNENSISFDTAWRSPTPVLKTLVDKFSLTCDIRAYDGGGNFWFIQKYQNGLLVEDRQSNPDDEKFLLKELKGWDDDEDS